ncbi:serine/threonine protein kinase, partial [Acidobacteria bacterium ACD]|nr:serine/threonine protein kinase [Acidobacteria bacterium ACD]
MAEVYKARMRGEEGFEKIVAIKRILPHMADNDDFITMFIDEAKLAAQLTHNNIIHIYDLGKVDQYHFIAMEFVDGKDLRSILKLAQERAFPLPVELALFVASKIANALDYAHRRSGPDGQELNLVHRDVSPQNILISFEGDIKLCDFGIAKATTKVSQTQTGALKGKLQYMSPEQAWGKKIDRRTDIFSLGIVLFEMLTGERLFTGDTDLTILEQVRDARVVAPSTKNPEVPKKVDQIVLKALSKDAKDRYQNASELEKDLNAVLYSFQPAPGPADLAIYMHRLLESQAPVSDEQIDAAFASAAAAAPAAEPQKKGKGLVISKKAPVPERAAEPAPAPAPPIEVSQPSLHLSPVEAPRSRTGLFIAIGVAAVALIAVGVVMTRGKGGKAPEAAPTPAAVAAATPLPAEVPTAAPAEPQKVVDPKQVEAEARRLAALEAEKLRQAAKTP